MCRQPLPVLLFLVILYPIVIKSLEFRDGSYEGLTVSIETSVPSEHCHQIIANLERAIADGSESIHRSLEGAGHWGSVYVLVPGNWPDTCVPGHTTIPSRGETPDLRIGPPHPVYKDSVWTQQARPCGMPGDFMYMSYRSLLEPRPLGRNLAREWAKYRYGVFDEIGYEGDSVYPSCYHSDLSEKIQVNGCSDKTISERGMCSSGRGLNTSSLVSPEAHSSLLFSTSHRVEKFCDSDSHDRFAPTKQNNLCQRRSVLDVIHSHQDFSNGTTVPSEPVNVTPTIVYMRQRLTRYVLVIEDTKDMLFRDSWSFLRLAIRKWVVVQLVGQVEVGLVSANESRAVALQRLTPLYSSATKDLLASNIPYTPGDSRAACLHCGIDLAYQMLKDRKETHDPANSVIVLIAPGTLEHTPELAEVVQKVADARIRIATITYPSQVRPRPLDWLAESTRGVAFTVMETNYNMATSFITTYFKLTNVFQAIQEHFYQGDKADLPIEIHRKEITDNGQNTVVGSFVLDSWLGEPASFTVLVHNIENPLIRSIQLVSPSHRVHSTRSDALLSLKLLTVPANINETGTWTYTIERFTGSPQPQFVQVMATPRSNNAPIVSAKLYTAQSDNSIILYTEVKRGDYPVLGAKVEVLVTKRGVNGSIHREKFELIDSGSGDPDIMKGDGVYSRYFSPHMGGAGAYTFEASIHDNFNTAYTWQHGYNVDGNIVTNVACCGSTMPSPTVEPLSPFQRILPPLTVYIPDTNIGDKVIGRVGDLNVQVLAADLKARLTWTAPDMGGKPVAKYQLKFAHSIGTILDNFDSATTWVHGLPFPLAPGSETTFTLDFTRNPSLLDQTLFFALRCYTEVSENAKPGEVSNWVRVHVPSPPPPPPVPTPSTTLMPFWTQTVEENVVPSLAQTFEVKLEFILPVCIGFILLIIAIVTYCIFCFRKKAKKETKKHPEKPLNVSIVPTENGNTNISSPISNGHYDMNNSVPTLPQYEVRVEEDQKRYSVTNYDTNGYGVTTQTNGNLSVISEYENRQNTLTREKTLSPYQSWSASQLLHEHERRTSPYGQVGEDYSGYYPPPVPPLPAYQQEYPPQNMHLPPPNQFMSYPPNQPIYNQTLQGSVTSVNSSKLRNVTMV